MLTRSSSKNQVCELQRRCDLTPFLHLNGCCRDVCSPGPIIFSPGERGLQFLFSCVPPEMFRIFSLMGFSSEHGLMGWRWK
ncbi:hypothetical protein AMECASPLE_035548 [Ameca splendens]|uniref:Uncharacterized protein n=1 Tax=Ameca splendens TaxID=208324 RepID=A0ABV0XKH4_9TELE